MQLQRSLFGRLEGCTAEMYNLVRQYRMPPAILDFPSQQFYGGQIDSSSTISKRFEGIQLPLKPYLIFDFKDPNPLVYNIDETIFIGQMISAIKNILNDSQHRLVQKFSIGVVTPHVRQRNELMQQIG